MDELGIKRAILSITSPGTHLKIGDYEFTQRITRETNEEVAQICRGNPDRFGFFASLPLPDVEGSLEEIDHAIELGALGFAIMTNAEGYYPGDERLEPVFQKLNRHSAIVFMHPTRCCSRDNPSVDKPLPQYPTPMMEYFFDTTRAVTNLLLSGTVAKFKNLTFLVAHCGATLPPLVERIAAFSSSALLPAGCAKFTSKEIKHLFNTRFYFDLAGMPFPDLIHGYLQVAKADRLLYGSDYPYTPAPLAKRLNHVLDVGVKNMFGEEMTQKIFSGNAQDLGFGNLAP